MINPLLKRDMVTTIRKSFLAIGIYLASLFFIIMFFKVNLNDSYRYYNFNPEISVSFYITILIYQISFVCISVPVLSAGSISGERERQTLDLLLTTKMSYFSIVSGKLMSSIACILLLIIVTLPVFSLVFYFGSLNLVDLFINFIFIVTTAFMCAGVSVLVSCCIKKTTISIMLAYIFLGIIFLGVFFSISGYVLIINKYDIHFNIYLFTGIIMSSPILGFISLLDKQTLIFNDLIQSMFNFRNVKMSDETSAIFTWVIENLWLLSIIFQVIVGFLCLYLASKLISPVSLVRRKSN